MRRLVALLVIALLGAGAFGLSGAATGLRVNSWRLSPGDFRSELTAISTNQALQCYITALAPVSYAPGAGGASMAAAGSASWAQLRLEGEAIDQYVTTTLHFVATPALLAAAETSLESELTEAAAQRQYSCPGTAATALGEMPAEMRTSQVQAQAASLYLLSKLDTTIPLTTTSLEAYFAAHIADYDTLCISLALVPPSKVSAFEAARSAGASVAELATEFSADAASAQKGGAYGCYGPTSPSYASVRSDVGTTPLGEFSASPQYITYQGSEFALYVAPTSRTPSTFKEAESTVYSDVAAANAANAATVKENILYRAAIAVDPAFGRWGLSSTGPTVFALATPAAGDVGTAATRKVLTTAPTTSYR